MKEYHKPLLVEDEIIFDNILLVSMSDDIFDLDEEGGYDEVWK